MPWSFGKKDEKKNPFEASMPLDTDELKIVEARYEGQQVFWGVGRAVGIRTRTAGEVSLKDMGGSGEYEKERIYEWEYLYKPSAMPGFIPFEKAKELMGGTVSLVSGQVSSSTPKPLTEKVVVGQNVGISPKDGIVLGPIPMVTISVVPPRVPENGEFTVSGTVTLGPGAWFPAQIAIKITNPLGQTVDIASVAVAQRGIGGRGMSGTFSYTTRAGVRYGDRGTYVVTAVAGMTQSGKPTSITTSFEYLGLG